MRKKEQFLMKAIVCLMVFVTIILSCARIFLGVEITDEAFYTAEAMLVNQGATPFVDNWTQAPGATLIYAFFVRIYELFKPDMEGVFLYMRALFLLYRICICVWIVYILRKNNKTFLNTITVVPLVAFFYSFIPALSYTSIPTSFLLIVSVLLVYRKYDEGENPNSNAAFWCGILMALATFSSPAQVINCVVYLVMIRCYLVKSWKKDVIKYILGGLLTAIVLSAYLVIRAGSVSELVHSLSVMILDNAYFELGSAPISSIFKTIVNWGKYSIRFYIIGLAAAAFVFLLMRLIKVYTNRISIRKIIGLGALIGMFVGLIYTIYTRQGIWMITYSTTILFVGVALCRFACKECKELNAAFDIIAIPEIVTIVLMALTVYAGISNRFYAILPMGLLCIPYCICIIKEIKKDCILPECPIDFATWIAVGMSGLCLTVNLLFNYQYFYRETDTSDFHKLTYRVEEGVYKGCYTTEQRGKSLIALERYIKQNTGADESVLFMEVVPMAYLMTEAHFCTPSTWDVMLYTYGFDDDTIMQEYFKEVQRIPDKVIYIDTGRDEMLSIEKEGYQFNNFINQHYVCNDVVESIPGFRIILYEEIEK